MSTSATLVQLAAELALFTVAVAGMGLSLRDGLLGLDRSARLLLVAGFAVLALVSFGVGSLTIERADEPIALAAVRCAGGAIVALGALRWAGSRVGRPTLVAGLVLLVVAAVLEARTVDVLGDDLGAEPLLLVAALVMGTALVVAGRHTIPGRIGTSVAGVLLAVVLVLSFVLSAVISRTVEDEALARYGDRAGAEAATAVAEAELSLQEGTLVAAGLSGSAGAALGTLAASAGPDGPAVPEADVEAARQVVADGVAELAAALTIDAPVLVVAPDGRPTVAHPSDLAPATALALAGDPVVREALEVDGPRQGVTAVAAAAYAVAAVPVRAVGAGGGAEGATPAGAVVVARPLDAAYLERRLVSDSEPLSLVLVTRDAVAASVGPDAPPTSVAVRRGRAAIDEAGVETVDEGRFEDERVVVARTVAAEGALPQLAVVLSAPADEVGRTRSDLFRSLFLVAMVAALLGIALAVLLGERIGGAIRRLTAAAARIREGDLEARAAVDREDELGELSTTFDAMAVSLHRLTDDLREAAVEEGRLRARLESVFAGVTEAVVAADADRRVTEANVAATALLGVDEPRDLVGERLDDVLDLVGADGHPLAVTAPRDRPRLLAGRLRPLALGSLAAEAGGPDRGDGDDGGPPARASVRAGTASESVPVIGTVASLAGPTGGRAGLVVVLRDVRREQALEAAKQDFLATIGHELRTPLTPIKGYAGVLRRRAPTAQQARDWADGIASGVGRLEHLVDRLVTFAAVTATGTTGPAPTDPVDVGELVDDLVGEWRAEVGTERSVRATVDADLPAVRGDRAQLRLALGELVDNAVRFSTPGAEVEVGARREGPDRVALFVSDAGGEAAATLGTVVEAFVQGEPALSRTHEGLGLGLSLTDRVARAHGGRLDVSPSPEGTTVSILVPVVTAGPHVPAPDDAGAVPDEGTGR